LIEGVKKNLALLRCRCAGIGKFPIAAGKPKWGKTYPLACSSQYEAVICFTIPTRGYCAYIYIYYI
jgi:hypothetical protein